MNAMLRKFLGRLWRFFCSLTDPRKKIVCEKIPVLRSDLLKGRRAFITGGTSGIGLGIAKAFVRSGADVVITGRSDVRLVAAKDEIVNETGCAAERVRTMHMDMLDFAAYPSYVDQIGAMDILVNNAGVRDHEGFGNVSEMGYDNVLDTNLKGPYLLSQEVARRWRRNGVKGNILNICSASSKRPGTSPYHLSKWGMKSMTKGFAKMLIKDGIVVNGLAPGITDSPMFFGTSPESIEHESNPSGRLVTVSELGNMAVMLVSSLCRMVVGDVLYATGGAGIVTFDD